LPSYRLSGALTSFTGCGDYLHYVRDEARHFVGPYGLQPFETFAYKGAFIRSNAPGAGIPLAFDAVGGALTSGGGAGFSASVQHSATTVQVTGVDEPDTVKTDGRVVVALTGDTLRVLDTHAHVLG